VALIVMWAIIIYIPFPHASLVTNVIARAHDLRSGWGIISQHEVFAGGTRGIGLEIVEQLQRWCRIVLIARSKDMLPGFEKMSPDMPFVPLDLQEPSSVPKAIQGALDHLGGLDILVISAANSGSEYLGLSVKDTSSYEVLHKIHVQSTVALVEVHPGFGFLP
jgi:NAD(P)-dependent dehydrogenase (short-subunit alcohol dehydrogenase family)